MDRRAFFKRAVDKSSKAIVKEASKRANSNASHWIRPPFAIDELEFLLACTRCGDCVESCPHDVIFALSAKLGVKAAGTPALDLLNQGCHLCEDWPCVSACEPNALVINESENNAENVAEIRPKLARVTINTQTCLPYSGPECGACISSCPVPGALTLELTRPVIDTILCTGCGLCRQACIVEPKAIDINSLYRG
jgi:ferredoxin-type protein NapG